MTIESTAAYGPVFTAVSPGIYVLVLRLSAGGTGSIRHGSMPILSANGAGNQGSTMRYLQEGDTLEYQGPAGDLFAMNVGSEL